MLRNYYRLAKPGIVYGNIVSTLASFLFASRFQAMPLLMLATLFGLALVIASGCVFNNYLDREIDRAMKRTQNRPLVTGAISGRAALIYGSVLGLLGLALLALHANLLTAEMALFGWIFYVIVYGLAKRGSAWGALVGSISGAVPIVVGYTAVTDRLDHTALVLFLILAAWQMPHFYAIAIYRLEEYTAAGVPVYPQQHGIRATKIQILGFLILYIVMTALLAVVAQAGIVYLALVLISGGLWLAQAIRGFAANTDDAAWARGMFRSSLLILIALCVLLAAAPLLP